MVKIFWTLEAQSWLKKIHDYIALDNSKAAKNTIQKIIDKIKLLKQFPLSGSIYPLESPETIRVLYYTHYRIAYRIVDKERIDILGVFHGSMEMNVYLKL